MTRLSSAHCLVLAVVCSCTEPPALGEWTSAPTHASSEASTEPATDEGPVPTSSTGDPETTSTGDTTSPAGETSSSETTAALPNEQPSVMLALSPMEIDAAGAVELAVEVSDDVVELDIVYRGEVLTTLAPDAFPYSFEVTSQRKCNDKESLKVIARDAEGLVAEDSAELTCSLPASGSEAAKQLLPGKTSSVVHSVAVHGDGYVAVGALDGRMAAWRLGPDLQIVSGWPRTIGDWTAYVGVGDLESSAVGVTVNAYEHILIAGNTQKNGVATYYVVELDASGARVAEDQGLPNEEAAGLAVSAGVIGLAGAVRTSQQPAHYDWHVWGYASLSEGVAWSDSLPLGPEEAPDVLNTRSEWARAITVLTNGELLVVGEREYATLNNPIPNNRASWQRYTIAGERVGGLWTSTSKNVMFDGANAVQALPDGGFAMTGWLRAKLGQPPQLLSWRFSNSMFAEYRLEPITTAEGKGIGRDRDGNIVLASLVTNGGQLDAWAFAFAGWAGPSVWSQPPYGSPTGWDGFTSIACSAWGRCLAGGFLTVDGELIGFLRLHNP